MSVKGRTIAVTGVSSGIGAASARLLRQQGATVVGFDIRAPAAGAVDRFVSLDQGDLASIDQAVTSAPSGLSGLMNIAGVAPGANFPPAKVLKINFFGLRYFTEKLLPKLDKGATIVNMSSGAGLGWSQNGPLLKEFLALGSIDEIDGFVSKHKIGNVGIVADPNGQPAANPGSQSIGIEADPDGVPHH